MKILPIGATDTLGSRILQEAVSRGHDVIAVVSREGAINSASHVQVVQVDARNADEVTPLVAGHDAVAVAY